MGEERKVYEVMVGNPERKKPLERQRRRWDDGIRLDWGLEWIQLAEKWDGWLALMNTVMNLRVLPSWS
jgi:hypothetical protein